jgi:hypothetical protein
VSGRLSLGFVVASVGAVLIFSAALPAQTCITQANLAPALRDKLADRALAIAIAVQAGDSAKVQSLASPEFAANFSQTASLIASLGPALAGDALHVTHLFQLDATNRKAGDTSDADFSCPLAATASETDFSIAALPPGLYAFATVAATDGPRPWQISLLLQQQASVSGAAPEWKMAGFYPRESTVAGHDGLWFWRAARDDAQAKEQLLAWLLYGEADDLLRPANFMTSTNLDKLRAERRAATPPELQDGISAATPLVVKSGDASYRFTAIAAQPSDDGKQLILALHYDAPYEADPAAGRTRNIAAAQALVAAHKALRGAFDRVLVIADSSGHSPFVNDYPMDHIP